MKGIAICNVLCYNSYIVSSAEFVEANRPQITGLMDRGGDLVRPGATTEMDPTCQLELADWIVHLSLPDIAPGQRFPFFKHEASVDLFELADQSDDSEVGALQAPHMFADMQALANNARSLHTDVVPRHGSAATDFMDRGNAVSFALVASSGMRTDYLGYAGVEGRTNNGLPFVAARLAIVTATNYGANSFAIERYAVDDDTVAAGVLFVTAEPIHDLPGLEKVNELLSNPDVPRIVREQLSNTLTYQNDEERDARLADVRANPLLPGEYADTIDLLIESNKNTRKASEVEPAGRTLEVASLNDIDTLLDLVQPIH